MQCIYIYIHICVRVFGENDAYVMGMITGLTHNYRDLVDRNLDNSWDFSTGILHEGREYPNLALNSLKMMRTVGFGVPSFQTHLCEWLKCMMVSPDLFRHAIITIQMFTPWRFHYKCREIQWPPRLDMRFGYEETTRWWSMSSYQMISWIIFWFG